MSDGRLIAGGEFDSITNNDGSRLQVCSLAVYDPSMDRWSSLGDGLGGDFFDAEVYAIAVDGPNVYVGGEFIEAGSTTVSHIAMWNGSQWSSMGGGIDDDGYISSIVVANGMVYAAGGFESAGATDAYNIARWDGAEWHGLGGTDDNVASMTFWKGELYAVGSFEEAGDISIEYAARWSPKTGNFRALGEGFSWLSLTGDRHRRREERVCRRKFHDRRGKVDSGSCDVGWLGMAFAGRRRQRSCERSADCWRHVVCRRCIHGSGRHCRGWYRAMEPHHKDVVGARVGRESQSS